MYLSAITLKQFRSYEDATFSFDKKLTLVTGKNGAGKTNLLEAVYILLQGNSFRVTDKDLIQTDQRWWRLDGTIEGEPRQVRYQLDHRPAKQLLIHDTSKRFMYKDRLPVVLFEPNDLQLVHGSPTRRRDALDTMLSALSNHYKVTLGRYERALQQRNNTLKKQSHNLEDALFSWDILLSEYGVEILRARRDFVVRLNTLLGGFYSYIVGDIQELTITYKSDSNTDISSSRFVSALHSKLPLDRLRGTTSFGPHRDDVEFMLRGVNAKQSASRGEVRTTLLALKMAYAKLLEEVHGSRPLLLFDDVFSELDSDRRHNLFDSLGEYQTIITDTHTIPGANRKIEL